MTKQRLLWLMAGLLLVALAVISWSGSAQAFPNQQDGTPTEEADDPPPDEGDTGSD
ncbi:MAG: hypothetical protein GYB65_09340, partial [Chloroflexi bacterium]|nr:hypothetical protein [Chloroflexota bacterium]